MNGASFVGAIDGIVGGNTPAVGAFTALTITTSMALNGPLTAGTSAIIVTVASTTGTAGFRLPHGTAPTSPTNGDVWTTTAGLFVRVNGATTGPLTVSLGAANTWTGEQTFSGGWASTTVLVQSTNYQFALGDEGLSLIMGTGGLTLTVPNDATANLIVGCRIKVYARAALTLAVTGPATLMFFDSLSTAIGSNVSFWATKVAANTWYISK